MEGISDSEHDQSGGSAHLLAVRNDDKTEDTTPMRLKFAPFTAETYRSQLMLEVIVKCREMERKSRSQEAHLKDGQLKFGSDDPDDKYVEQNPNLKEGNQLMPEYGEPPAYYMGLPLEEIDKGITDKTFVVLSRWLNTIQISRFSATPAFFLLSATNPIRRLAVLLCTNQVFDFVILVTILSNCICLAIPETNDISWLEYMFFGIYSSEMVIKVVARGLFFEKYTYLRDPWNWLDMIVVTSGIPSIAIRTGSSLSSTNASATQALRTFRVLRAVKTISIFPGLKTIVNAMLRAIKMLMEVVLLTVFCLVVSSLVSVQIYRGTLRQKCVRDPAYLSHLRNAWENYDDFYRRMLRDPDNWITPGGFKLCGNTTGSGLCPENFTCQGNIGENPNFGFMNFDDIFSAVLIMFQLMTIDFWENAYFKVLLTNGYLTVIFFILTVFVGSFYLLNIMLAVVTITYQEEAQRTNKEVESARASRRHHKQSAAGKNGALMADENLWAKLINKKHSKRDKVQKMVRLRTAIHLWKKMSLSPKSHMNHKEIALKTSHSVDIMQNLELHRKKGKSKPLKRRHTFETMVEAKRLRLNAPPTKLLPEYGKSVHLLNVNQNTLGQTVKEVEFSDRNESKPGTSRVEFRQKSAGKKKNPSSLATISSQQSPSESKHKVGMRILSLDSVVVSRTQQPGGSKDMILSRNGKGKEKNTDVPPTLNDGLEKPGGGHINEHSHSVVSQQTHAPDLNDTTTGSSAVSGTQLLTAGQSAPETASNNVKTKDDASSPLPEELPSPAPGGQQVVRSSVPSVEPVTPKKSTVHPPIIKESAVLSSWRSSSPMLLGKDRPEKIHSHRYSRVQRVVQSVASDIFFDLLVNFCIVLNTILIAMNHHGMTDELARFIDLGGQIFTVLFDLEALLKMIGFGITDYFKSNWNRFDFIIAFLSTISMGVENTGITSSKGAEFLRAFRLLRVLKLAQVWPAMNHLLSIIVSALAALGQLTIILGIILYIFAIIGLQLFKEKYNDYQYPNGIPRWNFKDFFHSFMLMFRVLCGEWTEPLWDCMNMKDVKNGLCVMVFIPTLIFGNFVVLNLFLALLLNAFGEETGQTDIQMTRRLVEAKLRLKKPLSRLLRFCCCKKKVRLLIHRKRDESGSTFRNLYNSRRRELTFDKMTMSNEQSAAMETSFHRARIRRGAARAHEVYEISQMMHKVDDNMVPSCFPKWFQLKFDEIIEIFNMSRCGTKWTEFRGTVMKYVKTDVFEYFILFVIIVSSILLAFEDYEYQHTPVSFLRTFLQYANFVFAVLFTLEMVLRWIAFGLTKYFTNIWTLIDFLVVLVTVAAVSSSDTSGNDQSNESSLFSASHISIFRALRAFRPLRVVSRIQNMKIVVNSLMHAIPAILNVFMVNFLLWLIFCVMGVQFFRGKFYKCISRSGGQKVANVSNRAECEQNPNYVWYNSHINFDNVVMAFLALFQVATFEGWMEIMEDAVDSTEVDHQPRREASLYSYLYFVAFIICGSFFSLNFIVGVIIDNFNVLKKKYEGSYLDCYLTSNQRNYYNTLKKMATRKPERIITPPKSRFQLMIYNLSISDRFEMILMGVVFLNMIVVGVEYSRYKLPCVYTEVIWVLDLGFCIFFIFEAVLKIIGLRMYYFTLPWNCYDFTVAVLSFVDVAVNLIHQYIGVFTTQNMHDYDYLEQIQSSLIISPIFLRMLRVFRISRILRIIKVAKGLRKVMLSLVISLPAIMNIMALMLLCLYIYAIVGMFLFSNIKLTGKLTPMLNFRSFKGAALLLLSLSTAAGWNDILDPLLISPPFCNLTHHHMDDGTPIRSFRGDCGFMYVATPYMVSYIVLTFLFIINMYIAVILENYKQAHHQEEVGVTEDDFDMFYSVWQRYDPHATQFIPYNLLSDFVADLDSPLGIPKPNEIALVSINLPILEGDRIHCLDILLALVRNILSEIDESDEMFSLKQQMNNKFRALFPTRTKVKMIATTVGRKKEDVAARTLQRYWSVFKTRQVVVEGLDWPR